MAVLVLTEQNFQSTLAGSDLVLVDFWAPWCGPCLDFAKTFEACAEHYPDAVFGKINVDEEVELARNFQIRSIPTLMVFRGNIALYQEAGALSLAALQALIKEARAVDIQALRSQLPPEAGT